MIDLLNHEKQLAVIDKKEVEQGNIYKHERLTDD